MQTKEIKSAHAQKQREKNIEKHREHGTPTTMRRNSNFQDNTDEKKNEMKKNRIEK